MGVGQEVGGFRLLRELGSGGFGSVYLGQDAQGRQVAVKLLHPQLAKDPQVRRYFSQELANARRVQGFCLAQVLDGDADATRPWLATEYIDGPTLAQAIRNDGPRTGADLQRLAVQTITALVAIHAAGVVHRDLKPANILLAVDGPRVIDFGIARALDGATSTPTRIGTLGYMAPEQIEGTDLGPAADVFAWGAVMVHAATGAQAFPGPTQAARINQTLNHPPRTADMTDPLLGIVLACMAKDPGQRPTARQVLDMLLAGGTVGQDVEDTGSRARPEAPSDDSPEESGAAELVIGNLSPDPMTALIDGTEVGTVPAGKSGSFPVEAGRRTVQVGSNEQRSAVRRIDVEPHGAVRMAFETGTGLNAGLEPVEEVVFKGSGVAEMVLGGFFVLAGTVCFGVLINVLATLVGLQLGPLPFVAAIILSVLLLNVSINNKPAYLGLRVSGLTAGAEKGPGKRTARWQELTQVSLVGEGAQAQLVIWAGKDLPEFASLKDFQGGKVVCVAQEIGAAKHHDAERLRAALRWFAGDLWVEQPPVR
ncbi:Serine_threonine-protein kinase PknD (plasmid) [Nocardiopsis dassonvillei]|uniref:serine/threonine-protein kinase n=1 Tax=Nocardiopsis dassonvillei TaxID=2014 RepID=UPI003F554E27